MGCDRRVFLVGLLGLNACASVPPPEVVSLPEFSGALTLDPVRQSIAVGADMLSHPQRMAGQPWEVARLVQALEFLAVELRVGARWNSTLPMASLILPTTRSEWREALGIVAEARAQSVIDSLTELRRAFAADRPDEVLAALSAPPFNPGGRATLDRFAIAPVLPRTTRAMLDARQELLVQGRERRLGFLL